MGAKTWFKWGLNASSRAISSEIGKKLRHQKKASNMPHSLTGSEHLKLKIKLWEMHLILTLQIT